MATRKRGGILTNMVTGIRDPWGGPMTVRDLDDTPDDGNRYEVIDGELHVTPFPTTGHQKVAGELYFLLRLHVGARGLGDVFFSGLKVVLDELTGVGPDIVYIAKEQSGGIRRDGYHGPPTLVVEVLSSKPSLDTKVKRGKYARAGIQNYWIVDPDARTLLDYSLAGDDYELRGQHRGDETFRPVLFPGLEIPLGQLWFDPIE
jgi:Uma2 family endonuclease